MLVTLVANSWSATLYVAPDGNDASPGSREQPLATLDAACHRARTFPVSEAHRIVLRGGRYFNVSVTLQPEDSGLSIEAAPGETPWLIGGQRVSGWVKAGEHFYAAPLPAFPPGLAGSGQQPVGGWQVRLLEVDGEMRPRARFPAQGALSHLTAFDVPWMSTTGGGWKRPPTREELTTLVYKPGDLPVGLEVQNAEITVFHMWDESCVGLAAQDSERQKLTLTPPLGHPAGAFGVKKFVLWNTREGMTAPGCWYHDRMGNRLVYWPLAGEDMNRCEVVAPVTTTILRLKGRPDSRVKRITIRDVCFSVTTVPLIAAGFAAEGFDGAISLEGTENCAFIGLTISRVAGHGLSSRGSERGARVENCEVSECGAGGIYLGGNAVVISNNLVRAVGRFYPSAAGIYRSGRGNLITHNEVHDCSYSAINYGGEDTIIEANLIYDCMKVLHDGAAIYVFGGKRCLLRRNFARDISDSGGYGASAYYLDEQCRDCVVEENLSLRVGWPSHNHMASNNIIRANVFLVDGDAKLTFPRSSGYTVEGNVIYANGRISIDNPSAVQRWSNNVFYSSVGKIQQVLLDQYSRKGVVEGAPEGTTIADPQFRDWRNGDCAFPPDSPAAKLGITPLDPGQAGRRKGR